MHDDRQQQSQNGAPNRDDPQAAHPVLAETECVDPPHGCACLVMSPVDATSGPTLAGDSTARDRHERTSAHVHSDILRKAYLDGWIADSGGYQRRVGVANARGRRTGGVGRFWPTDDSVHLGLRI